MAFLDDYEPVEARIAAFYSDHPDGCIRTELVSHGDGHYIVKASVYRPLDDEPGATGYAEESVTQKGVNSTSALENCETSAVGRALANLGYAAKGKRASREEMSKASGAGLESSSPAPETSPETSKGSARRAGESSVAEASKGDGNGKVGEGTSVDGEAMGVSLLDQLETKYGSLQNALDEAKTYYAEANPPKSLASLSDERMRELLERV